MADLAGRIPIRMARCPKVSHPPADSSSGPTNSSIRSVHVPDRSNSARPESRRPSARHWHRFELPGAGGRAAHSPLVPPRTHASCGRRWMTVESMSAAIPTSQACRRRRSCPFTSVTISVRFERGARCSNPESTATQRSSGSGGRVRTAPGLCHGNTHHSRTRIRCRRDRALPRSRRGCMTRSAHHTSECPHEYSHRASRSAGPKYLADSRKTRGKDVSRSGRIPELDVAAGSREPGFGDRRAIQASGAIGLIVPEALGGAGATARDSIAVQREIGSRSPSLGGVATTMHHLSLATLLEYAHAGTADDLDLARSIVARTCS